MKQPEITLVSLIEPIDGKLDDVAQGLLAYSARLASQLQCPWNAVAVRELKESELGKAGRYGTPSITFSRQIRQRSERPEQAALLLTELLRQHPLPVILLPHNALGITLAPILAARLDGALAGEVRQVETARDGIFLHQSVVGSKIVQKRKWHSTRPLVLTVPLAALSCVEVAPAEQCSPVQETWEPEEDSDVPSTKIIQRIPPDPTTVDLIDAEIIFCAGKGCSKENVEQLDELCRSLGISLGVTRPVYDLGWCDFSRMIGQTGRTVRPKLYVSFGVSGSKAICALSPPPTEKKCFP